MAGLRVKMKCFSTAFTVDLRSTKNRRGSTATNLSKWRHFGQKLPPLFYSAFKVPKRA